jgi:hypothetical protein
MRYISRILTLLVILFSFTVSSSQEGLTRKQSNELAEIHNRPFCLPMRIVPVLSGNFGELRSNHFHSGLDFKTQKSIGIPVYAVEDGWISRIRISSWGLGYSLYISHPDGYTSLYAHLDRYAQPFDSIARSQQYEIEQFELDSIYEKGKYPVKKGQLIAYSGNSGISSAPHLHFEIRETKTGETMDPLLWYSDSIPDKTKPSIRGIAIFACNKEGNLAGNLKKKNVQTVKTANGNYVLKDSLPAAWGKIGLGIKAYDLMDNTSNIYGVRLVRLYMDDKEIFSQNLSHFSFSETRYINSIIDYEAWIKSRSLVMKSFLEPGNHVSFCAKDENRGYINIADEKNYNFRYELSDRAGNTTEIRFSVKGKKMPVMNTSDSGILMRYFKPNSFKTKDIELYIPLGTLYDDLNFNYFLEPSKNISGIFHINDSYIPIQQCIKAKFRINVDTIASKRTYYLAMKNRYGRFQYYGGHYENGWIMADIREFGTYTIMNDDVSPKITPLNLENSVKNRLFRIQVTDNASGLKSWRGTIDGKWILLTYNYKTAQLKYVFDDSRLTNSKRHIFHLEVTDACGNRSELDYTFLY